MAVLRIQPLLLRMPLVRCVPLRGRRVVYVALVQSMIAPDDSRGIALQLDLDEYGNIRIAQRAEPEPTDEEIAEAEADLAQLWGSPPEGW